MKTIIKKFIVFLTSFLNVRIPKFFSAYQWAIPINGGVGLDNLRISENWMKEILEIIYRASPFDLFIDVGVNTGQTLMKVKSISQEIKYLGFEPNPVCVQYANGLIGANDFKNSMIIPVALSSKTKMVKFYAEREAASDATIVSDLRKDRVYVRTQYVPSFAFDDISPELGIGKKTLIKIDVEGSELEVIQGMSAYLRESRPPILCEVLAADNPDATDLIHARCMALRDLIRELGYEAYQIQKSDGFKHFRSVKKIDHFYEGIWDPSVSPGFCDYIFIHRSDSMSLGALRVLHSPD